MYLIDENNKLYIDIYEDTIEEILYFASSGMKDILLSLKNQNKDYDLQWNDDLTEVSFYNNGTINIINEVTVMLNSMLYQGLNNNKDWKLTIKLYKYDTKELVEEKIIR